MHVFEADHSLALRPAFAVLEKEGLKKKPEEATIA